MFNRIKKIFQSATMLLAMAGFAATAQTSTQSLPPLLQSVPGSQTGITFANNIDETEHLNVLAYEYFYNGGGVAIGDLDNDGLQDIFFTSNMGDNKLYQNLGKLKFKDVTNAANPLLKGRKGGWKTGVTMADVNGDGLLDIYVCYSGKVPDTLRRNQLFINKGHFHFEEMARQYGLDDPGYSTQAAFFDFDNDGDLDMFLLNHNVKKIDNMELAKFHNQTDPLAGDKLFENVNNHFVDITAKAGIHQYPLTFGLGIAIADVNKDGWQDIYVTNDYNEPDYLYINNHDGTFTDETSHCFRHLSQFSMGVDIADFNNDCLPDVVTLDMLPEDNRRQKLLQLQENYEYYQLMLDQGLQSQFMRNMLQLNNGDGTFSEIGQLGGISNTDWSWCPLLVDLDDDGYKDLVVTNGYMRDYTNKDFLRYWGDYKIKKAIDREPVLLMDLVRMMPSTSLSKYVFRNKGDLTFQNVQSEWGFDEKGISSGAAYADLDNDGDLDLVVNNLNREASLYRNMERETLHNNFVSVQLSADSGNTFAVGAKACLYYGVHTQYEELNPSRGYLSRVTTEIHFGIGKRTSVDSLKIVWPGNKMQMIRNVPINQTLRIHFQAADAVPQEKTPAAEKAFAEQKNFIDFKDESAAQNDFKRQPLMLFMYSKTGPVMAAGDINGDGLEDLFISRGNNSVQRVYLQQKNGTFIVSDTLAASDKNSSVSAAVFFDANGDGKPDLYLAHGGYSLYEPNTPALQDELFLGDGKGHFTKDKEALPDVSASSKSCVRPCDYDHDGDMDLFIGGRIVPGQYPVSPKSYLLRNDGKGKFTSIDAPFLNKGMITDARWADMNGDGHEDLVTCGEFMPIGIYINNSGGFADSTDRFLHFPCNGLWNSLAIADIDNDGRLDIIAGNLGDNTQIRMSAGEPAELYYADFDHNGSIDPFFNFYIQGVSYPFVSRDELNEQIYPMRKKFTSYFDYAGATMQKIFSPEELSGAKKLTASQSNMICLLNRADSFEQVTLPIQAQFTSISNIVVGDYNHDGNQDIVLLGNHSDNRLKLGSLDAGYGALLEGDGNGQFRYVDQVHSGLCVNGDVKSAVTISTGTGDYLLIGASDQQLQAYKINDARKPER